MAELLIKGPDGRVITCPRVLTVTEGIGTDRPVVLVDEAKLKPGWSVYVPSVADDLAAGPVVEEPIITITAPAPVDAADLDADLDDLAWKED